MECIGYVAALRCYMQTAKNWKDWNIGNVTLEDFKHKEPVLLNMLEHFFSKMVIRLMDESTIDSVSKDIFGVFGLEDRLDSVHDLALEMTQEKGKGNAAGFITLGKLLLKFTSPPEKSERSKR